MNSMQLNVVKDTKEKDRVYLSKVKVHNAVETIPTEENRYRRRIFTPQNTPRSLLVNTLF